MKEKEFREILQSINEFLREIVGQNELAILLFLVGIGYSYYLYRKSNPHRELWIYYGFDEEFESRSNGVIRSRLYYKETELENIIRSYFSIVNRGKKTILSKDILEGIKFKSKESNIIDASIYFQEKNYIGATLNIDNNEVLVNFTALNHNEGFLVEIVHTRKEELKPDGKSIYPEATILETKVYKVVANILGNEASGVFQITLISAFILGTVVSYIIYRIIPELPNIFYITPYSILLFLVYSKFYKIALFNKNKFWSLYKKSK